MSNKNRNYVWVGNKQSDIDDCNDFFDKTISLYGCNDLKHISFKNARIPNLISNTSQNKFIEEQIKKEISKNPNTKFMFYNQCRAYSFSSDIINNNFLLVNDKRVVDLFNNKIEFRKMFNISSFHFPKYIVAKGFEINKNMLSFYFTDVNLFVLQQPFGAGCDNTILLKKDDLFTFVKENTTYLVSEYIEDAISFNRHVLITDNEAIVFQPSIQMIDLNMQSYKGADFINAHELLGKTILNLSYLASKEIAHKMKLFGYRGVCGFDFMCDKNKEKLYAIEINARFQASSFLLNMSLKDNMMPSLQELNYYAKYLKKFFNAENNTKLESTTINYSSIIVTNEESFTIEKTNNSFLYAVKTDSIEQYKKYDDKTYLIKLIYKKIN